MMLLKNITPTTTVTSYSVEYVLESNKFSLYYGKFKAIHEITLSIPKNSITALIGPSGCGKSSVLRAFNRMHDLIPGTKIEGKLLFRGSDIYSPDIDPVDVRKKIGMVFQKPNPFPKSIYDNILFGPKINNQNLTRKQSDELVETVLIDVGLWNEVKDKLKSSALSLSGGQQQRLCIARALAVKPEVILMDEPCSALDPASTLKIEELMQQLRGGYTILIVTHNMQQAARASNFTAMLMTREDKSGELVEFGATKQIFQNPQDVRTQNYIEGKFG